MKKSLLSLALLGTIAASGFGGMSHPMPVPRVAVSNKKKRGLFNDMVFPESQRMIGRKGAGICMAQQKRAAQKRRNRARHKAAARGRA